MKCFQVVQRVLEQTYGQVPGADEAERKKHVERAMKQTAIQYRRHLKARGGPDFADPATRFAYVCKYVPAHAHWLQELVQWSPELKRLFLRDGLRMVAVGGGPGSDVVGILKYMDESGRYPRLFCEIIDGCLDWKTTWADLAYSLDWERPLHTDYVIHDARWPATWSAPTSIEKADLVTLNFFVSEIYHLGDVAARYLTTILGRMKAGALLALNDNNADIFMQWFDQISASLGLEQLLAGAGERKIYDAGEQRSDLGRFARFIHQPKLQGDVAWRVLRRR